MADRPAFSIPLSTTRSLTPRLTIVGAGAGAGGLTGHLTRGISRGDLKDLGEELETGSAAVIVLGESKIEDRAGGKEERRDLTTNRGIGAKTPPERAAAATDCCDQC
jgi:hypothetical protein